MLKFDLQAAGLKKPIIQRRFTARRNLPQTFPPLSTQATDPSIYPPVQDIVSSNTTISYPIQSDVTSSTSAINKTLTNPSTNTAPPVSQQIIQGLSRAVVIYHERHHKTQVELLKEDWLVLSFFKNMTRRPRLMEYGSSRGEVRQGIASGHEIYGSVDISGYL